MMKRSKKGFTLIEMMVVIAIIAVLVAVIVPVVKNSTQKANAATNAANLRSVEGEIVAMMLIDPYAFGDQFAAQSTIDSERAQSEFYENAAIAAQNTVDHLQGLLDGEYSEANIAKKQAELDAAKSKYDNASRWTKWMYKAAVEIAQAALDLINDNRDAIEAQLVTAKQEAEAAKKAQEEYQAKLDADEYALYNIQAGEGFIILPNGTKLQAPVSKAVNIDDVNIDKDVPMSIFIDTINIKAYAYYNDYQYKHFAAVAGDKLN